VCGQAEPCVAILWPPNHKLETVAIQGVAAPDNDQLAISITGITQDEPVNGLGDGKVPVDDSQNYDSTLLP
jgi:hypothetical protein